MVWSVGILLAWLFVIVRVLLLLPSYTELARSAIASTSGSLLVSLPHDLWSASSAQQSEFIEALLEVLGDEGVIMSADEIRDATSRAVKYNRGPDHSEEEVEVSSATVSLPL